MERYKKLIKNRDNRPYLDKIYYQMAILEQEKDSLTDAILYYNKSLRAKTEELNKKHIVMKSLLKFILKT